MGGDFLIGAQITCAAAAQNGLSAQARTDFWPSPPGSPDRAIVRLDTAPLRDMAVPRNFDIEVIADPLLAVVPPMGNALLPGGRLIVNAAAAPHAPPEGPPITAADLSALCGRWRAPLGIALSAAAWAALAHAAPELGVSFESLAAACAERFGPEAPSSHGEALRASFEMVRGMLPGGSV